MFLSCFERMKIQYDVITTDTRGMYGFNGSKFFLIDRILVEVILMCRELALNFLLIDFESTYDAILSRDCTISI